VYSHSGEFAPEVLDLDLAARGVSFQFLRKYRSARSRETGLLGRGWTFTYAKWLERDGEDLLYHDGHGRIHRFAFSAPRPGCSAPDGFYAVLDVEADGVVLRQRWGDRLSFEPPESGGRLRAIEDRNGNALRFEYREGLVLVSDPFGRPIEIRLEGQRVAELRDHGRRSWLYRYDSNGCLVEVAQPAIQGVADRPRVRYGYDHDFRLVTITDPNGQTFLRNDYDEQGRVRRQQHGSGMSPPPAPTPTPASKKQETPKQEQPKPEDKKPVPPGTPVATPNPVDGTGEGIDKDWWRGRPNADVLGIVAELRGGIRIDERHGTPQVRLIDSINTYSLAAVLAPQPISVDERGETVSINLAGAQSRSTATGTTSDGWGDRPRTLAEALAAPRIRAGNIASRF
jgi:YD repeat-containing protein